MQSDKTHQIHKQIKNKIFGTIESLRRQQINRWADLKFIFFIHRKTSDIVFRL
jgi:hypothetical protein